MHEDEEGGRRPRNGREGREAAMEGRAGDGTGRDGFFGSAAPRIRAVARQALPRQRSAILVAAMSALCHATMHGATQAFDCARAICAAKNVSLKKTDNVRFKIILKKELKFKKNSLYVT